MERLVRIDALPLVGLSEVAAALGLEIGVGLHPAGEPIVDKGHQALIGRFRALLGQAVRVAAEVPLPNVGDRRSWDLLLRIGSQLIGVELETRIRDIQRLVRHIRARERDGGAEVIVVVLSASRVNRRLLGQLLEALGPGFGTPPRAILGALRAGTPLPGSGVVLV